MCLKKAEDPNPSLLREVAERSEVGGFAASWLQTPTPLRGEPPWKTGGNESIAHALHIANVPIHSPHTIFAPHPFPAMRCV